MFVDAAGRVVPRASNRIEFAIEGPGTIIATDNGDETDFDDFRLPSRKAFNGWCQALVRAKAGAIGESAPSPRNSFGGSSKMSKSCPLSTPHANAQASR